jgi:hypothetical protein
MAFAEPIDKTSDGGDGLELIAVNSAGNQQVRPGRFVLKHE